MDNKNTTVCVVLSGIVGFYRVESVIEITDVLHVLAFIKTHNKSIVPVITKSLLNPLPDLNWDPETVSSTGSVQTLSAPVQVSSLCSGLLKSSSNSSQLSIIQSNMG